MGGNTVSIFQLWSPAVLVTAIAAGWLYTKITGSWSEKFRDAEPVPVNMKRNFYLGLILFFVSEGTPLGYLGHNYMFSAHMTQMSLNYLIIPPLILTGLPAWVIRPIIEMKGIRGCMKLFTHPIVAVLLFNLFFSFYHIPFIMNTLMANDLLLFLYHTLLVVTSFTMWFPVFCPVPEWDRITSLQKIAFVAVNGVLLTPACALIIFAQTPLYEMYLNVIVPFPYLSLLDDQQLGGVIMKIMQEITYGIAIGIIFFKWFRTERSKNPDLQMDAPMEPQENNSLQPSSFLK